MNQAKTFIFLMAAVLSVMVTQAAYADDSSPAASIIKSARLTIPGADCASTGAETDTLLRGIAGVASVDVDIEKTTADITYDASKTSIESIKETMKAGGYPVTDVKELE